MTATRIEINADPKEDEIAVVRYPNGGIVVIRASSISLFLNEDGWRDGTNEVAIEHYEDGEGFLFTN